MTPILASSAGLGDPFVFPPVAELFEWPAIWFENTAFAINRTVLIMLLATLLATLLMVLAFRRPKLVPGRFQAFAETIVEFVRDQIAVPVMGTDGHKWLPYLTTIFLFVWLNNLFEILPFFNFPATSRMAYPAMLGIFIWATFIVVGIAKNGVGYLIGVAFPPGVPKALYILLTPVEIISTFIVRPITLAVRLFANMLAGHILLTIVFLAIHSFIASSALGFPVGVLVLLISPVAVGFELFVGVLQAYIMTILAAVYIGGALHPEH